MPAPEAIIPLAGGDAAFVSAATSPVSLFYIQYAIKRKNHSPAGARYEENQLLIFS